MSRRPFLFSPRGELLVLTPQFKEGTFLPAPLLTVELVEKWYDLWLVEWWSKEGPGPKISPVKFDELEPVNGHPAFVDHAPCPVSLDDLVLRRTWVLDVIARELAVGRWIAEGHRWGYTRSER